MLPLILFLNGMAVMVLEMAGARLLAPWMGTSIVVWTSLIGIILASLSLGNWLGGRLADRILNTNEQPDVPTMRHARSVLSGLLIIAAAFVLITALTHTFVLETLSRVVPFLPLASVCAAILLFAAPSALCGMISPYGMRLAITRSKGSGSIIGKLSAVATMGSIVGTFLGGFVLIFWFGSTAITLGVAACLLMAAFIAKPAPLLPKAFFACVLAFVAVVGAIWPERGAITLETPYSTIKIFEGRWKGRQALFLRTDSDTFQSATYKDAPSALLFDYTRFYQLGTFLNPQAKRLLMLGGGGYSVPKWLLAGHAGLADFSLDVVEIDPGMTHAAQKYFGLPSDDPRLRILHEDARVFLNRAAKDGGTYDVIFSDVFHADKTAPFQVGTVEAAQRIRDLLSEDGVFVMNSIGSLEGKNSRLLYSLYHAFSQAFGQAYLFPVQSLSDGNKIQNVMLLAFRSPRALPDPETVNDAQVAAMLRNLRTGPLPDSAGAVHPLTDDYAPVDRYMLGFYL